MTLLGFEQPYAFSHIGNDYLIESEVILSMFTGIIEAIWKVEESEYRKTGRNYKLSIKASKY